MSPLRNATYSSVEAKGIHIAGHISKGRASGKSAAVIGACGKSAAVIGPLLALCALAVISARCLTKGMIPSSNTMGRCTPVHSSMPAPVRRTLPSSEAVALVTPADSAEGLRARSWGLGIRDWKIGHHSLGIRDQG